MAALPTRPFVRTGVDFAGLFDIRNYTGRACLITKGYLCLFIYFATKAIYLEAVSNLSTSAFLARCGYPKDMYSDNGTNFIGAWKILNSEIQNFLKESGSQVNGTYGSRRLTWHSNPAGAPHMGDLWEAGVKSLKHHFKRLAGSLKYSFEEFSTLLTRVETCLNSRPLCPLTDNSDCLDALTPGQ